MNGFWPLFRKEVRVFAMPAIVFFVFVHVPFETGPSLLFSWLPDWYHAIAGQLSDPSLMNAFAWYPIFRDDAFAFMYTTLFLFMLVQGYRTQLRTQLHTLPVHRMTILAATFAGFAFWVTVFEALLPMIYKVLSLTHAIIVPYNTIPYSAMLILSLGEACTILSIASTGMFGFVVAASMPYRWLRYAVGAVAGLAGYVAMSWYVPYVQQHVTYRISIMPMEIDLGFSLLPSASILPVFILVSMLIYERFGEV